MGELHCTMFRHNICRLNILLSLVKESFNITHIVNALTILWLWAVRDSPSVRRLFFQLAGAVGRQRALHTENSGFASPTLGRHISTFRGYRILFSIRNPYMNRFTNHFSIHS